ncbi:zeaxanthin epoxidase [Natrinema mahii]|nr:zeaxanthin epoxidase [Natrinema mahii]
MNHTRGPLDIAVVGGGICGLTTAIALEQRGFEPTVYEAASDYRPVGAGILLQANALLVFDRLGIVDRVRAAGQPLEDVQLRSPSGRILSRFDLDGVERSEFGYGAVAIYRPDLQRILLDELNTAVETGTACEGVDATETPTVRFDDGTRVRPDVVVGADGIHSTVRDAIVPAVELRTLDSVAYRAIAEIDLPPAHRALGFEVWGDGTYAGGAPIGDDRFYWFATTPGRQAETATAAPDQLSALRDRLVDYSDPIPTVVDSLEPDDVVVTALEDVPPLERWSRGSVVLAGDAAHGMYPFAGQGAAQAIEDALALAHSIAAREDPSAAIDAYVAERKPRAERIRSESHRLGTLGTIRSTVGCRLRNLAFDCCPDAVIRRARRTRIAGTSLPATPVADRVTGDCTVRRS